MAISTQSIFTQATVHKWLRHHVATLFNLLVLCKGNSIGHMCISLTSVNKCVFILTVWNSCWPKVGVAVHQVWSLQWRHNGHDSVSNHQPYECLLNHLFRRRSKKTSKLRVTGLCAGNSQGPVNSPHEWPITRKMFPFDDAIMYNQWLRSKIFIDPLPQHCGSRCCLYIYQGEYNDTLLII